MTVLDAPPPAEPTAEATCPVVAELRGRRTALIAEERRRAYLQRLLRARLDLEVAETLGPPPGLDPVGALGEQLAADVFSLPGRWDSPDRPQDAEPSDLVSRLRTLDDGLGRLDAYGDALHSEIERCTAQLVEALRLTPRAGLPAPRPSDLV